MPAVSFDFATWIAGYSEFSNCSSAQGQAWFDRAGLFFSNSTTNPAYADGNLAALLYLLTSHIAWLSAPRDATGQPASSGAPPNAGMVGRVKSAAQGSVSVDTEMGSDLTAGSPSQPWFMQTQYGAEFWNATAQYRTFTFAARPTIIPENTLYFRRLVNRR